MLRILIADDHSAIRQSIKLLLKEEFPGLDLEEAEDTDSLIQKALNSEWDIVITDLSMPGGGGIFAMKAIRETKPFMRVILMSTYSPLQYEEWTIKAGADFFVSKDVIALELADLVRKIIIM
jgi:two-component system invasion response regulator UvrY